VSFAGNSGGEVRKTRPAIIVSNDDANRVQVVPLSSKTDKLYPGVIPVRLGIMRLY